MIQPFYSIQEPSVLKMNLCHSNYSDKGQGSTGGLNYVCRKECDGDPR